MNGTETFLGHVDPRVPHSSFSGIIATSAYTLSEYTFTFITQITCHIKYY